MINKQVFNLSQTEGTDVFFDRDERATPASDRHGLAHWRCCHPRRNSVTWWQRAGRWRIAILSSFLHTLCTVNT